MVPRAELDSVDLALAGTEAADFTGPAAGHAVEIRLRSTGNACLHRPKPHREERRSTCNRSSSPRPARPRLRASGRGAPQGAGRRPRTVHPEVLSTAPCTCPPATLRWRRPRMRAGFPDLPKGGPETLHWVSGRCRRRARTSRWGRRRPHSDRGDAALGAAPTNDVAVQQCGHRGSGALHCTSPRRRRAVCPHELLTASSLTSRADSLPTTTVAVAWSCASHTASAPTRSRSRGAVQRHHLDRGHISQDRACRVDDGSLSERDPLPRNVSRPPVW